LLPPAALALAGINARLDAVPCPQAFSGYGRRHDRQLHESPLGARQVPLTFDDRIERHALQDTGQDSFFDEPWGPGNVWSLIIATSAPFGQANFWYLGILDGDGQLGLTDGPVQKFSGGHGSGKGGHELGPGAGLAMGSAQVRIGRPKGAGTVRPQRWWTREKSLENRRMARLYGYC
jgi:hypothetical protein